MENSQKPQRKGVVALTSFIVILALMVLGLVTAYYFKSDRAIDLQQQVTELKASAAEKDKALAQSHGTSGMTTAVRYREIPELGVKYKLTEQTKGLTYSYRSSEAGNIRTADFSTIAMSAMKDSNDDFPCTSPRAPSGGFTLYKSGSEIMQGGRVIKDIAKRVGNYYYLYTHPQFACSVNGRTVQGLEASIDAVKAAYDSLEAM